MSGTFVHDLLSWIDWTPSQERDDYAIRQIHMAYEEHAAIIDRLKEQIDQMKRREKQLIQDFSSKLRKLEDPNTAAALETISKIPYDEDLPMDEFTSKVRVEERWRKNTQIQSRRFLQEVRSKMESILKDKMKEVLMLEKKVESLEKEKLDLSQRLHLSDTAKIVPPPVPLSTMDSVIGSQFIQGSFSYDSVFDDTSSQQCLDVSLEKLTKAMEEFTLGKQNVEASLTNLNTIETKLLDMMKTVCANMAHMQAQNMRETLLSELKQKDSRIQELESRLREKEEEMKTDPVKVLLQKQLMDALQKQSTLEAEKAQLVQDQKRTQEKSDQSIRAIQRVLADVTLKKDAEISALQDKLLSTRDH